MFLPMTQAEIHALGWDRPDVILVTGDAYIDSPYIGVAVIGKYLLKHGFTAAVIAQPSLQSGADIMRLGEPRLFWGVTAGSVDSMVANYTASGKFRRQDDYTPGGVNVRPDRASIVYANLIRRYFRTTRPIVLGGMEASLRRIAHYDHKDRAVRRSVLPDAKADILAYGMAEKTVVLLAAALRDRTEWKNIPGICYMADQAPPGFRKLPSCEAVMYDKKAFMKMTLDWSRFAGHSGSGLVQQHGHRYLVQNPAPEPLTSGELDEIYEMDFEHDVHPYGKPGKIRALDTIRQSITAHRGCFGQCHFCAIAVHQGKNIVSRTPDSLVREAAKFTQKKGFNGIINDVGGPTANMYGAGCRKNWNCRNRHCLVPRTCPDLVFGHRRQMDLLARLSGLPGVTKVVVSSGIRHDLVLSDRRWGKRYMEQLVRNHVSGQLKVAPEHSEEPVLKWMNKPPVETVLEFRKRFEDACRKTGRRYFLTYYLMAAHPGCTPQHMRALNAFLINRLKIVPEQVQIFTPTPGTLSTAMYYCGTDTQGNRLYCDTSREEMTRQKKMLQTRKTGRR